MEQHIIIMIIVAIGSLALLVGLLLDIYLHIKRTNAQRHSTQDELSPEEREITKKRVAKKLRELSW